MKKNILVLVASFFAISHIATAQQIKETDLKTNVQQISNASGVINSLEPVTYQFNVAKFKNVNFPQASQFGFLTSKVKDTNPAIVKEESKVYTVGKNASKVAQYDAIDDKSLLPLLVAAFKEQQKQIELLQNQILELKKTKNISEE